jgi:hypothetical protein
LLQYLSWYSSRVPSWLTQNVVIDQDNIASTTIIINAKESSTASGAWFAYLQLAVYDAINHRHRPYLFGT